MFASKRSSYVIVLNRLFRSNLGQCHQFEHFLLDRIAKFTFLFLEYIGSSFTESAELPYPNPYQVPPLPFPPFPPLPSPPLILFSSPPPSPSHPSPQVPTFPYLATVTGTRKSTEYGNDISYTTLTLCSPLTGVSSRPAESWYFSICKHNMNHGSNISPQPPSDITDGGNLPGKLQACQKERWSSGKISIHSENRQSKHSTRPLLVQKCKCPCYNITVQARAILTNHGLKRRPWARSHSAWEGREGAPRSSAQSSAGSPGQAQTMPHYAKTKR